MEASINSIRKLGDKKQKSEEMKKDFYPNDKDKEEPKDKRSGDDYLGGR